MKWHWHCSCYWDDRSEWHENWDKIDICNEFLSPGQWHTYSVVTSTGCLFNIAFRAHRKEEKKGCWPENYETLRVSLGKLKGTAVGLGEGGVWHKIHNATTEEGQISPKCIIYRSYNEEKEDIDLSGCKNI